MTPAGRIAAAKVAAALAAAAGVAYLALRVHDVALAFEFMLGRRFGSSLFAYFPFLVLALEAWFVVEQLVFALAHRRRARVSPPPLPPLSSSSSSSSWPVVSVLVPVTDEPRAVIEETVRAALALSYPRERFEVLVLDDAGGRDDLAPLAAAGARVRSRASEGAPGGGFKAGNLNFGVRCARDDAALFLLLDADQAPVPGALMALVPYAALAPASFGFVQAPQTYRGGAAVDDDAWDRACREFHHVAQAYRAHDGAVMLTGTSALVSRAALAAAGGFDEATVTEDIVTGARMQAAGFASFHHEGAVAFGLVPSTRYDLLRQRLRWATGMFQFLRRLPFMKLGARAALAYMAGASHYLGPPALFCAGALPALVMIFGFDAALFYSTPTLVALAVFGTLRFVSRQLHCPRRARELAGSAFLPLALGPIYAYAAASALWSPWSRPRFRTTPKGAPADPRLRDALLLLPALCLAAGNAVGVATTLHGIALGEVPLASAVMEYGGILALGAWFAVTAACAALWPVEVVSGDA